MKKILFVIDSLTCGGAEKSLINLLSNFDYENYHVDLMVFRSGGKFEEMIPREVNFINAPHYFMQLQHKEKKSIKGIYYRIKTSILLRLNLIFKEKYHSEQIVYKSIKRNIDENEKEYDCAVAYSQGMPTYYVSNHVKSNNKLAWINCNYVATKYDKDLDKEFYDKINHVVVVSNFIKETLIHYPFYKKICVINDIVDPNLIIRLSNKVEDYKNELEINELKILTVARLEKIKGFDLLVNAAKSLKEKGVNFKWFIIGEGSERKMIESYCKKNELEDTVILLGMKINPYIYMKKCDIYVQTSKNEGLGLTVIEAKILEKIIICTNFSTASSLIEDKIDGRLCKINYEDIAEKIELVNNNNVLKNMIQNNLKNVQKFDTLDEIKKIYKLINED